MTVAESASNLNAEQARALRILLDRHPAAFSIEHYPAPRGMHRRITFRDGHTYTVDVFGRIEAPGVPVLLGEQRRDPAPVEEFCKCGNGVDHGEACPRRSA